MSDNAEIANLLKAAEALLRDKVIANTQSDTRFAGLMVASAISMAERSLKLEHDRAAASRDVAALAPIPNPFASDGEALVHLIRGGLMDGADDAHHRLLVDAIIRTSVTRPALVTCNERRLAGLED
jgi:Domain of unknown function (DUF6285)